LKAELRHEAMRIGGEKITRERVIEVFEPSEKVPFSALLLADILYEAGLPPEMCQVVTGDPGMPLVKEETFGPVSPIIRFRDLDDAIRISNSTAYGLSSSVCTNRMDYSARFVSELQVGTVNVREVPGYRLELTPFGGIKDSGLGYKEGVQEAIESFTNVKTYSLPWA
jgi:acyl-CoA reductase-like NAD-dependent aldehyde dehydrogenase